MFTVEFYETTSGECPVKEFIKSQDVKMRAKIYRTLELLEEHGTALRMPHSEYLDDGIFQIRVQVGNNITRVLYFFMVAGKVIVTKRLRQKNARNPAV